MAKSADAYHLVSMEKYYQNPVELSPGSQACFGQLHGRDTTEADIAFNGAGLIIFLKCLYEGAAMLI